MIDCRDGVDQNFQNVSHNTDMTFTYRRRILSRIIVHTYTHLSLDRINLKVCLLSNRLILKKYDFKKRAETRNNISTIYEFAIHTWFCVKVFRLCHVEGSCTSDFCFLSTRFGPSIES